MVKLNGGNGTYAQNSGALKKGWSAGRGSCILRCTNLVSSTGVFETIGGRISGNQAQAGFGAILILNKFGACKSVWSQIRLWKKYSL